MFLWCQQQDEGCLAWVESELNKNGLDKYLRFQSPVTFTRWLFSQRRELFDLGVSCWCTGVMQSLAPVRSPLLAQGAWGTLSIYRPTLNDPTYQL